MNLHLSMWLLLAANPGEAADCGSLFDAETDLVQAATTNATAFLERLDNDAMRFQPGLVPARPFWEQQQFPLALPWTAEYAGISAAGDLGYTVGSYGPDGEDPTGTHLSVWHRADAAGSTAGQWRLLLDHRVGTLLHPPPEPLQRIVPIRRIQREPETCRLGDAATEGRDYARRMEMLKLAEEQLPDAPYANDSWLLGPVASTRPQRCMLAVQRLQLSRSGEFALTTGGEADGRSFVRIWRLSAGGSWQVELELCAAPEPARR